MANRSTLNEISQHLDNLVMLCQAVEERDALHQACFRFQMEHATAKAQYSLAGGERSSNNNTTTPPNGGMGSAASSSEMMANDSSPDSSPDKSSIIRKTKGGNTSRSAANLEHMKEAMYRMADFSIATAKNVLDRMKQRKRHILGGGSSLLSGGSPYIQPSTPVSTPSGYGGMGLSRTATTTTVFTGTGGIGGGGGTFPEGGSFSSPPNPEAQLTGGGSSQESINLTNNNGGGGSNPSSQQQQQVKEPRSKTISPSSPGLDPSLNGPCTNTLLMGDSNNSSGSGNNAAPQSPTRSRSVDDIHEGSEDWMEIGANITHNAVQILSLLLVADTDLRADVQTYLLDDCDIISYLRESFALPREVEIACYAEGYRTMHMSLLANLVYQNPSAGKEALKHEEIVNVLLNCRTIDEENPGLGEWGEFALRNICFTNPDAREYLKQYRLMKQKQAVGGDKGSSPIPF